MDISWNKLKFLPSEIKDLSLEMIDVTAYNDNEKLAVQDTLNQLLQTDKAVVRVGTLFEYAAATVLNCRLVQKNISLSRFIKNISFIYL